MFVSNTAGGGYVINNSLRFSSASSQYLSRTPASTGNRKTFTFSFWCKRGKLSTATSIYSADIGATEDTLQFGTTDKLFFFPSSNNTYGYLSDMVFRDVSSCYHIVVGVDTTQATAADRLKVEVNGVAVNMAASPTVVPQNYDWAINNTVQQLIGLNANGSAYLDGNLSEFILVDGQKLSASSFGETNPTTGQWVAKKYTGTYGTNGFYLDFKDGTSTTTLGYDAFGSNDWTLTNFTRSAGVNDCWMKDVPSGNGSGAGVQPSSNYAVLNPLKKYSANTSITNANLTASDSSASITTALATIGLPTTGKYYFEVTVTTISAANGFIGVATEATAYGNTAFQSEGRYRSNGDITNIAGTLQTGGTSYISGDVVGVAVDVDNGTVQFYKNNTTQGATPSFTFTANTSLVPYIATDNNAAAKTFNANFGQRSFQYTPPTGFKALCTANLPTPSIIKANEHFDVVTHSGDNSARSITGARFTPDFLWAKSRNTVSSHRLMDKIRGFGTYAKTLMSDTTAAETEDGLVSAFVDGGYSIAAGANFPNVTGQTYVSWLWKANGAGVTNTDGSITSTVSANTKAGFSIVTVDSYPITAGTNTLGHGLGVAPKMIIIKNRDLVDHWYMYNSNIGNDKYLMLSATNASSTSSTLWGSTSPTASVFTLRNNSLNTTTSQKLVAYCFSEIEGYSKIGSYVGNGSADGTFIFCGFLPRWVLIKQSSAAGNNWQLIDTARETTNPDDTVLFPNTSAIEGTGNATIDVTSSGFKVRTADGTVNTNAATYIFYAVAEMPFKYSNGR